MASNMLFVLNFLTSCYNFCHIILYLMSNIRSYSDTQFDFNVVENIPSTVYKQWRPQSLIRAGQTQASRP